jgi:NAD(P)-dependent dehydrogenase (short-subunit alcohol dehydrogenase family)
MTDLAVVVGSAGGLGAALVGALATGGWQVVALGRGSDPALDLLDEGSIAGAAAHVARLGVPRMVVNATGFLHGGGFMPERSWRDLDAAHMAHAFAVNAIGPALLMKHFLPLLPRQGRSVFATLSARVGSIGDNRLGGWYAYRASKAALNQIVRTASIELKRRAPEAVCVALHPGTVATGLSAPFARAGLEMRAPEEAAAALLAVIGALTAADSGGFFDHKGAAVPW